MRTLQEPCCAHVQ